VGLHQCPSERNGQMSGCSASSSPSLVPFAVQTGAKAPGFSPTAPEFTAETDYGFHNAHEFVALYPDDTRPSFGYCLPLAEPGMPELTVIRTRLFERAASLGHSVNADPDLHLVIDPTILAA